VNTDDLWPDADIAWLQVLKIQTKLHQWATDGPGRRFDDLYNLVYDPAVLVGEVRRDYKNYHFPTPAPRSRTHQPTSARSPSSGPHPPAEFTRAL
jgi:hypothetical protein